MQDPTSHDSTGKPDVTRDYTIELPKSLDERVVAHQVTQAQSKKIRADRCPIASRAELSVGPSVLAVERAGSDLRLTIVPSDGAQVHSGLLPSNMVYLLERYERDVGRSTMAPAYTHHESNGVDHGDFNVFESDSSDDDSTIALLWMSGATAIHSIVNRQHLKRWLEEVRRCVALIPENERDASNIMAPLGEAKHILIERTAPAKSK